MPDWQDSGNYPWGKAGISNKNVEKELSMEKPSHSALGGMSESGTKPGIHSALLGKPFYTFKVLTVQPMGLGCTSWDALLHSGRVQRRRLLGLPATYKGFLGQREEGSKWLLLQTQRSGAWEVCLQDRKHQVMVTKANAIYNPKICVFKITMAHRAMNLKLQLYFPRSMLL